jgi:DNA modification methylase
MHTTHARFLVGDTRDALRTLPTASVDLVLTSPPFLALRSYLPADHPQKGAEVGGEATPADYVDVLLDVAEACDRVLAPHGSLVFEIGDTYSGSGGAGGDYNTGGMRDGQPAFLGSGRRDRTHWPLPKSLCGIPAMFAFSLAYGRNLLRPERATPPWRIRNVVAWCKPNPPVGRIGDKFRPATSYLTIATHDTRRYFDLDSVRADPPEHMKRAANGRVPNSAGAPPLDYWEVATHPYAGSHYATWPERLIVRPILTMVPPRVCRTCGEPTRRLPGQPEYDDCGHDNYRRGIVLDPFAGTGTTGAVAVGHGRDAILIDIDERNADLARQRLGMFVTVEHTQASLFVGTGDAH